MITAGWHNPHRPARRARLSGVHIRARAVRRDDRCGGVGGSALLRAIRAVSSASRARVIAL